MTPTDLAAALERMAAQTHYETGDVLRGAARRLREVDASGRHERSGWLRDDMHTTNCAVTLAKRWGRDAVCTCGLDALRRAMGGT